MGNFNESIQDINKTLALEPRHFGALDGLGQIQFKLNNFYESIQTYEKLLTIVPHSSSAKKMLKLIKIPFFKKYYNIKPKNIKDIKNMVKITNQYLNEYIKKKS